MKLLAIETVTDACSVAVVNGDRVHARHELAPREHTTIVFDLIDDCLAAAGIERRQLDAVAFGRGPGSFTGVRIAATLAQGIALACALPVVGVSSLAALAQGALRRGHRGRILAALDARRAEIYYATFNASTGVLERLGADSLAAPGDLVLPGGNDWIAIGNALEVYHEHLPANLTALARDHEQLPAAADVATLALNELVAGRGLEPALALPLYLRGAVD